MLGKIFAFSIVSLANFPLFSLTNDVDDVSVVPDKIPSRVKRQIWDQLVQEQDGLTHLHAVYDGTSWVDF